MKKILEVICLPYTVLRDKWRIRQRIKALRKRDPFIYK